MHEKIHLGEVNFYPNTDTVSEICKYYLGADLYMFSTNISVKITGTEINMTLNGGMHIKKNCSTLKIGGFFKHANEQVIAERKLITSIKSSCS